jgi:AcrR family transcriptional regulator
MGYAPVDCASNCGQNGRMTNKPLSAPEKRRPRHRPDQTRQEILKAAQTVIQTYGFAAMSISGLARQLGMSTTNIHKYFRSKDGLAEAVCGLELSRFVAYIKSQTFSSDNTRDALRLFAAALLSYNQNNTIVTHYMFELYIISAKSDWTVFRNFRAEMVEVLESILQVGVLCGDVRPNAISNAEQVFDSFATVMHPLLVRDYLELGPERGQNLADFIYLAVAYSDA